MKNRIIVGGLLSLWCVQGLAVDLQTAYEDAKLNDPVYQASYSTWMSAQQDTPIARSMLLPDLKVSESKLYDDRSYDEGEDYNIQSHAFAMTLTQPIFNYRSWENLKKAEASVKKAQADYASSTQDLITRVSSAYFLVLTDISTYQSSLSQERAYHQQYDDVNNQYKVGQVAEVNVLDAQSQYDLSKTDTLKAKNQLAVDLEKLAAITGRHYKVLNALGDHLPLVSPAPDKMSDWSAKAAAQNYSVQSARYFVEEAKDKIKMEESGYYPSVEADASYVDSTIDHLSPASDENSLGTSYGYHDRNLVLTASLPLFSGGNTYYSTKQARYDYQTAAAGLSEVSRQVDTSTRSDFMDMTSDISQVKTNFQALMASKSAFEANTNAYQVGSVDISDVLDSIGNLYKARTSYAHSRYAYLTDALALKADVATLSDHDVTLVNGLLTKAVKLDDLLR